MQSDSTLTVQPALVPVLGRSLLALLVVGALYAALAVTAARRGGRGWLWGIALVAAGTALALLSRPTFAPDLPYPRAPQFAIAAVMVGMPILLTTWVAGHLADRTRRPPVFRHAVFTWVTYVLSLPVAFIAGALVDYFAGV
jgi:hypothetical protein